MKHIDLNCDMGELPQAIADGTQEELMRHISSANIACGGHAGDEQTMRRTIEQALDHNVSIGAHPSYRDPANFGRSELQLMSEEIAAFVYQQILALERVATACGATITHVKPHGALYNQAARDRAVARAIAQGVRRWRSDVILVGLAGSAMLDESRSAGFPVAAEAFADRRYEKDGSLRSRKLSGALLGDPEQAAQQALQIAQQREVTAFDGSSIPLQAETICLHGDTPGAVAYAAAVHARLTQAGIQITPLRRICG
jgi:5-oxoprolinase (ATP-hydrolysing) subunit A